MNEATTDERRAALLGLIGDDADLNRLYRDDPLARAVITTHAAMRSTREAMLLALASALAEQRDVCRSECLRLLGTTPLQPWQVPPKVTP